MESSGKTIKKPVTLKNIKTGKVQTWPSQTSCAKEFGLTSATINALLFGRQKTIGREWVLTNEEPVQTRKSRAKYKIIDHKELEEFMEASKKLAEVQRKYGKTGIQEMGRIDNKTIADILGIQEVNESYHDWDGRKDGHIGFENKNNNITNPRNLDGIYQDCSHDVMKRFKEGGIGCHASFNGLAYPTHCVVYSINKEICDCLEKKSTGKRNSAVLTLEDVITKGNGQIIAINLTPEEVYNDVISRYPNLKGAIIRESIRPVEEARSITNRIAANLEEPTNFLF